MGSKQSSKETIWKWGGWLGKTLTPLNERLQNVKWGEYNVQKLFGKSTCGKRLKGDDRIPGTLPFVTAGEADTGVSAFIGNNVEVFKRNTTTIDMFGSAKYRNYDYGADDHVAVVHTEYLPKHAAMFITAACHCAAHTGEFNYGHNFYAKDADELNIMLPTTYSGEIDFAFMESFMRELEELRLHELEESRFRELEAYLLATGLNNCELTAEDRSALENANKLEWKDFRVGDIFNKIKTKKLPYKAKELPQQPMGRYSLPCLTSSFMNQGLNYYAPREGATILNNVISIPSNSDVYRAYYQSKDFTVLSDAYAIHWKDVSTQISSKQYLFMVACINKVTDLPGYSYKNKLGGWNVVKDKFISLPATANGQPDLAVMEQLVTSLQKIVIADIAKYTARRLDAARSVVEQSEGAEVK